MHIVVDLVKRDVGDWAGDRPSVTDEPKRTDPRARLARIGGVRIRFLDARCVHLADEEERVDAQ